MLLIMLLVYLVSLLNNSLPFKTQLFEAVTQTTVPPQPPPHWLAVSCMSVDLLVEVTFLRANAESCIPSAWFMVGLTLLLWGWLKGWKEGWQGGKKEGRGKEKMEERKNEFHLES